MEFFIVNVDGRFGAVGKNQRTENIGYSQEGETFLEFSKQMIKDYPKSKFHYCADPEIIKKVKKKMTEDKIIEQMIRNQRGR